MLAEALTRMQVLETTLSADKTAFYAKLEVDAPASVADARLLQSRLSDQTWQSLWDHWQVAGGVRFEWFLKAAGAQSAGFESRQAPSGQLHLLAPNEVVSELEFLEELAGVTDETVEFVPFAKLKPNGELLALHETPDGMYVVLVHLDLILSVQPIAPSLGDWWQRRMHTYFLDGVREPGRDIDELGILVLNAIEQPTLIWPPKGRRQL